MRAMKSYHKAIGIMVMGLLLALLVQAAAAAESDSITITCFILPHEALVANFTANATHGTAPLAVQFYDNSTGSPTAWNWSFGDATFSALRNPVHTYPAEGSFAVGLTVNNSFAGNSTFRAGYIAVGSILAADFTANATRGPAPFTVNFTDLSTGSPATWNWSFGDIGVSNTSTLQHPVHTYQTPGIYTVNLTVSNAYGSSSIDAIGLVRVGLHPNASFAWSPAEPEVNQTIEFNASASMDPDGYITAWNWSFGDGTQLLNQTTPFANHAFMEPRVYNVTLTVIDNETFTGTTILPVSVFAKIVTIPTAVNGTTADTVDGVQSLGINATTVNEGGGNVTNTTTSVTMTNTSKFWQTIEVRAGAVNATIPGNITVQNVTEVVMQSVPITSVLNKTIGNVSVVLDIALKQYVQDAAIEVKVMQGANATAMHGFQLAANKIGNDISDVAYTVELSNTGLINTNLTTNATRASQKVIITMSVSHAWVKTFDNGTNHEGRDEVRIIRINESGNSSILDTRFVRYDPVTNLDWSEADSPDGLSIFGMITMHAQAQAQSNPPPAAPASGQAPPGGSGGSSGGGNKESGAINPAQQGPPETQPETAPPPAPPSIPDTGTPSNKMPVSPASTDIGMIAWLLKIIKDNPVIAVILIAAGGVLAHSEWRKRRIRF